MAQMCFGSSSMPATFRYTPISTSRQEIRLVDLAPAPNFESPIQCILQHVLLTQNPTYECLSYVWGSPHDTQLINLHGHPFSVTKNLDAALRHLRYRDRPRTLWIDAIAINQQDVKERDAQVAIMGLIYASASSDLLWMGPDPERFRYATFVLKHIFTTDSTLAFREFAALIRAKPSLWRDLMYFFESPVWERMWIVQELALSKVIKVICGVKEIQWKVLRTVAFILTSPVYVPDTSPSASQSLVHIVSICRVRDLVMRNDPARNDLLWLWSAFGWGTCAVMHDRIFAILNIMDGRERMGLVPRYGQEVGELFRGVTRRLIAKQGSLLALGYGMREWTEKAVRSTVTTTKGKERQCHLPSWCPDYGSSLQPWIPRFVIHRAMDEAMYQGLPWTQAAQSLFTSVHDTSPYLHLLGLELDVISSVTESTHGWPDEAIVSYYRQAIPRGTLGTDTQRRYFNGDSLQDAYLSTICAGLLRTSKTHWDLVPYSSHHSPSNTTPSHHTSRQPNSEALPLPPKLLRRKAKRALDNREAPGHPLNDREYNLNATLVETTSAYVFGISKMGHFCLVPEGTQPGDVVVSLRGGVVPFVVRRVTGGSEKRAGWGRKKESLGEMFRLVGPAYVHGFMDGLAEKSLTKGTLMERQFVLV
jgi:hypothetical protein